MSWGRVDAEVYCDHKGCRSHIEIEVEPMFGGWSATGTNLSLQKLGWDYDWALDGLRHYCSDHKADAS